MSSKKFILHSCQIWTLSHSQCQRHTNGNNIKQALLIHFGHINTHLFFIYFVDIVNRNWVSGGNQIKWNYVKKSKPVNYANLQVFIFKNLFFFFAFLKKKRGDKESLLWYVQYRHQQGLKQNWTLTMISFA